MNKSIMDELQSLKDGFHLLLTKVDELRPERKEILGVTEAMELLGVGRKTLDAMIASGDLKSYRIRRKIWLKRSEILERINEGLQIPEQAAA